MNLPQPRISSRPSSRDVSPRSSFDHARNNGGLTASGPSDGYLGPGNGGRVTSPLAESPGVPIPGGWPVGSSSGQYAGQASQEETSWHASGSGEGHATSSSTPTHRSPHLAPHSSSKEWSRLPRIMTTTEDPSDGPRSAPTLPPPQLNPIRGVSPNRASSVPDPRIDRSPIEAGQNSGLRNSPSTSGLATSNGPPVLATPYYSQKDAHLQFPTPQLPVPPRRSSSHLASHSPTERNPLSTSPNSTGSHSNGHGSNSAPPAGEAGGRSRSGTERSEKSERSGRSRGEPTYCGQCEQVVHGQFVRAMGKVYHLNCFRCKASVSSLDSMGLN